MPKDIFETCSSNHTKPASRESSPGITFGSKEIPFFKPDSTDTDPTALDVHPGVGIAREAMVKAQMPRKLMDLLLDAYSMYDHEEKTSVKICQFVPDADFVILAAESDWTLRKNLPVGILQIGDLVIYAQCDQPIDDTRKTLDWPINLAPEKEPVVIFPEKKFNDSPKEVFGELPDGAAKQLVESFLANA